MKRKAAQAEIISHPRPKKRQLTAWNLHLRKYAATEGRYKIAVSVIILMYIGNVESSLCFQVDDKLFKLVRFFFYQKASTIYQEMSATDKEQLNNDTGESIVMTGTEKSKRCQRIFNRINAIVTFIFLLF